MKKMKWLAIGLAVVMILVAAGAVLAQTANPPAQTPLAPPQVSGLAGLGIPGGGWKVFDAAAAALNLSPTQLFDRVHGGQTVAQVAQAQGVDLKAVQEAVRTARLDSARQALAKAVSSGRITQAQADWIQKGLDNGWFRGPVAAFLKARLR